jgi:hypothetical protein
MISGFCKDWFGLNVELKYIYHPRCAVTGPRFRLAGHEIAKIWYRRF